MSSDLEDTHSVSMDIFDFIQKKKFFMENFQNKYDNKQLNSNNYSFNKIKKHTPIDLYEEKEEKDNQFKKSFDEVFLLYNNNFEDRESNFENNNRDHSSNNKDIDNNNEYKDIFYFAEEYNVYSNQKIYKFFNKTLGDVFSADISKKNSNFLRTHPKDYNKNKIETLKKENKEKNVIEILNLTVKELHEKYIKNEIPGLNFENDLIQIEKKHGIEYKDKYEKISLELKDIINEKGEKIKNI